MVSFGCGVQLGRSPSTTHRWSLFYERERKGKKNFKIPKSSAAAVLERLNAEQKPNETNEREHATIMSQLLTNLLRFLQTMAKKNTANGQPRGRLISPNEDGRSFPYLHSRKYNQHNNSIMNNPGKKERHNGEEVCNLVG
ncbi:hypothetical protein EYR41_011977 [Orbilia oligospora]|uniref:Uncharacterized protein n=1 Tax=Orbilia oligospora TaxID=2813651 RepID=A0A8H2DQI9_ORBOL|nr:hypothetical protein EYR41_011977 [Orbilia oligospora]